MGRTNKHKNPFFNLTLDEMDFIRQNKEIKEEHLDEVIEILLKCIKGYWKYKFYQKLYYMNGLLNKTKQPFIISRKPDLTKKDDKFVITFD